MTLGKLLQFKREISTRDLAKEIRCAEGTLAAFLSAKLIIADVYQQRLAKFLGCPPDRLLDVVTAADWPATPAYREAASVKTLVQR